MDMKTILHSEQTHDRKNVWNSIHKHDVGWFVCLFGKMQFSHHSSLLFQHMCNSYLYITTFLCRRTTVFKLYQASALIWWVSSFSLVPCLSSQELT